jgi:hypothetical protein
MGDDVARASRLIVRLAVALVAVAVLSSVSALAMDGGAGNDDAHNALSVWMNDELDAHGYPGDQEQVHTLGGSQSHPVEACSDRDWNDYDSQIPCQFVVPCDDGAGYVVQTVTYSSPPQVLSSSCLAEEDLQQSAPTLTPELVRQALTRIPLPPSQLSIQPPGGAAPVNFAVIFSTEAAALEPTINLLGHQVQLVITPSTYRWSHGDGTEQVSDWAGRAYARGVDMGAYITHVYASAATMGPSVDITYAATFRVDGGPAQQVPGTVTVEGDAVPLVIKEAAANLTGRQEHGKGV